MTVSGSRRPEADDVRVADMVGGPAFSSLVPDFTPHVNHDVPTRLIHRISYLIC